MGTDNDLFLDDFNIKVRIQYPRQIHKESYLVFQTFHAVGNDLFRFSISQWPFPFPDLVTIHWDKDYLMKTLLSRDLHG